MYLFLKKRKHKIPGNNILNDEQPFNDFVKHSEFFMNLTSGPLFRFLSPVIDIYALPALSTSIQFTLFSPSHTLPCFFALSMSLYLPVPKNFSFQNSDMYMFFRRHSTTVLPICLTDLFM